MTLRHGTTIKSTEQPSTHTLRIFLLISCKPQLIHELAAQLDVATPLCFGILAHMSRATTKTFKCNFNYALYSPCKPQFPDPSSLHATPVDTPQKGLASGSLGKFTHKLTRSECNVPPLWLPKLKVQKVCT